MTYNKDQYNSYQRANQTISEIKQLIMLYEGAINFIEQAKQAIDENDFEKRFNLINKAIAIINGLNSCLEFNEATNDTSKALDTFYQEIDMRLLYIQCNNSKDSCDSVIRDLKTMLNAWVDIEKESYGNSEESDKIMSNIPQTASEGEQSEEEFQNGDLGDSAASDANQDSSSNATSSTETANIHNKIPSGGIEINV